MTKYRFAGFVLLMTLVACASKNTVFWEQNDEDMKLQLMTVNQSDPTLSQDYKLRIYPAKRSLDLINSEIKSAMWYKMDSSVYLLKDGQKIYPQALEPVSNGVKNSFEYLVLFENNDKGKGNLKLIYEDKHFNKRTYTFNLTKE